MKIRVKSDDGIELSTLCRQLKLEAPDGKQRGAKDQRDYEILTAEISKATFGVTPVAINN